MAAMTILPHEPPNAIALANAECIRTVLGEMGVTPMKECPSAEGGIAFVFSEGDTYADIECFNSGEIYAAMSDQRDEPHVFEVDLSDPKPVIQAVVDFLTTDTG